MKNCAPLATSPNWAPAFAGVVVVVAVAWWRCAGVAVAGVGRISTHAVILTKVRIQSCEGIVCGSGS